MFYIEEETDNSAILFKSLLVNSGFFSLILFLGSEFMLHEIKRLGFQSKSYLVLFCMKFGKIVLL